MVLECEYYGVGNCTGSTPVLRSTPAGERRTETFFEIVKENQNTGRERVSFNYCAYTHIERFVRVH